MKNTKHLDVDYRVRTVARIDNMETGRSFDVLCYGVTHADMCILLPRGHDRSSV